VDPAQRTSETPCPKRNIQLVVFASRAKTFSLEKNKMQVGDLVTLSTAGKKIRRVADQHRRFFWGPNSGYYVMCEEDRKRFYNYWQDNQMVGLVTKIVEKDSRPQYDWEKKRHVYKTSTSYEIAWQANPKVLAMTTHSRGHLKFVKRHKGK